MSCQMSRSLLNAFQQHMRKSGLSALNFASASDSVTSRERTRLPSAGSRPRGEGIVASCGIRKPISLLSACGSCKLSVNQSVALSSGDCFGKGIPNVSRSRPSPLSPGASTNFRGDTEGVTMPAAMVDTDVVKFDAVLKAAEVQGSGTLLVLFLANRDSALGKSWCPDCVRAEPVIYKVVDGAEKPVTLVRVYVGDRPTWRNSEHALRKDSRFALKGVPTLIKWENGGITGRLEDYEAHVEEKVRKLVS